MSHTGDKLVRVLTCKAEQNLWIEMNKEEL